MQYIKLTDDKWVEVDEAKNASRVILKTEVETELTRAQDRLKEIPEPPTDEELLVWAKQNYPQMDYSKEKEHLEDIIAKNTVILEQLK